MDENKCENSIEATAPVGMPAIYTPDAGGFSNSHFSQEAGPLRFIFNSPENQVTLPSCKSYS